MKMNAPTPQEKEEMLTLVTKISEAIFDHAKTERGCLIALRVIASVAGQSAAVAAAHIHKRTDAPVEHVLDELLHYVRQCAVEGGIKIIEEARAMNDKEDLA